MNDSTSSMLQALPQPVLPARPAWIDLYWRCWDPPLARAVQARGLRSILAGAQGQAQAAIRTLRQRGEDDEADEQAAHFLDQLASSTAGSGRDSPIANRLEVIAIVLEEVIGLGLSRSRNRVTWRMRHAPPVGLNNLHLETSVVNLLAEEDEGGGVRVLVEASQAFELAIDTGLASFSEQVPAGRTRYLLTYLDRTDVRQL